MKYLALMILLPLTARAASFERRVYFSDQGVKVPYRLLLPENYDPKKSYPLIVWLHGKGERGDDNEKQLANGAERFLDPAIRARFPVIVLAPQCPEDDKWTSMSSATVAGKQKLTEAPTPISRAALALVSSIQKSYAVKQTSIIGISMGAFAAMDWMARKPGVFSAAVAMSGGGDVDCASALARSRIWFMHGRKDSVVKVEQSLKVEEAVRKAGGHPQLTVIEDLDHGPWDDLAVRPDVLRWLLEEPRPLAGLDR